MNGDTEWQAGEQESMDEGRDWDIAVIGMAGRFPGSESVRTLWDLICQGKDSIVRWQMPNMKANDKQTVSAFGKLRNLEWFAADFFNIPEREALWMDPQQRFLLECVYEALEDAGYMKDEWQETIGLFCGADDFTYVMENMYAYPIHPHDRAKMRLFGESSLTAKVSYKLNLQGPSIALRTACSTSLTTVHIACQSLLNYECDLAVAGGVSITPYQDDGYSPVEGTLSPDGYTRPFDKNGQGCVPGNGIGLVVLKRLKEAILDRDHIYAVIKGSAVNHDGMDKAGYAAPSVQGQMRVIRNALEMSDVKPEDIEYLECHGTATPLGDAVEIKALKQVYGENRYAGANCYIGSVKGNIGHLNTAAGAAGLIKAIWAVKEGILPPSLHCTEPHPELADSTFRVNTHLQQWPKQQHRRKAGVSSFGLGGNNAHVVLEQAPDVPREDIVVEGPHLYVASAKTPQELAAVGRQLKDYADSHDNLRSDDVAYTLQAGRQHHSYRTFAVAQDVKQGLVHIAQESAKSSLTPVSKDVLDVVFLFPGAGTNAVGQGAGLYKNQAVFREEMNRCLEIASRIHDTDYEAMLFGNKQAVCSDLQLAEQFVFHLSVSYSLAKMWMAFGFHPSAVIGHSFGEYVAACVSGLLTLEDAIHISITRGELFQSLSKGRMLSVSLEQERLNPFLREGVSIAAVNANDRLLLSGEERAIRQLEQELSKERISSILLPAQRAGHSPLVDPIIPALEHAFESVTFGSMNIPIISTLTGTWAVEGEMATTSYWSKQTREPVRFAQALQSWKEWSQRPFVCIEAGSGEQLGQLARKQLDRRTTLAVVSIPADTEPAMEWHHLLYSVGRLWQKGAPIRWEELYGQSKPFRVSLPTYPFTRKKYWKRPTVPRFDSVDNKGENWKEQATSHHRCSQEEFVYQDQDKLQAKIETGQSSGQEAAPLDYRNDIERDLVRIFHDLTGRIPSGLDEPLLIEGLDSLAYLELGAAIRKRYSVSISLKDLYELETITAISDYLVTQVNSGDDIKQTNKAQPIAAAARGNKTWNDLLSELDK
ncbi:beta-ketoacyl synthase N-terminal-like domain-containing protein [Aneurinibacillus aneurinilyticus]|uniref:type I polyketide synthase n=1 Tax=Aneurinibacillus aneurinilyticus TaxID=1391 RepID=UPI002E213A72|nr:beta-ketoacyl synthase N-terminal-like domain-containing protein [Aneurinibacillus aneurinilyticus]